MIDIDQKRLDEAYLAMAAQHAEWKLREGKAKAADWAVRARLAELESELQGDPKIPLTDPIYQLLHKAELTAESCREHAKLVGPYIREWGELSSKQEWAKAS